MTPEEFETCEHAEPYRPFCNDCIRELRTERDRLLQECAERMPTSFGKMKWACGHEGPAVCQKCATSWRNERDRLQAENEALRGALTTLADQGYWSRKITEGTLRKIMDEYVDFAKGALKTLSSNTSSQPPTPPEGDER